MGFVFTWSCQFPCSALYMSCPGFDQVSFERSALLGHQLKLAHFVHNPHSWGGKLGWNWGFGEIVRTDNRTLLYTTSLAMVDPYSPCIYPWNTPFSSNILQYWNCIKTGSKSLAPSIPAHVGLILIWSQAESDQLTPGSDQQDPSNLIRSLSRSWRAPRAHALQLFWLHPQL